MFQFPNRRRFGRVGGFSGDNLQLLGSARFPKTAGTGNFGPILPSKPGPEKQNGKGMPMPNLKREIWCRYSDVVGPFRKGTCGSC
jgi:hypothetical protein